MDCKLLKFFSLPTECHPCSTCFHSLHKWKSLGHRFYTWHSSRICYRFCIDPKMIPSGRPETRLSLLDSLHPHPFSLGSDWALTSPISTLSLGPSIPACPSISSHLSPMPFSLTFFPQKFNSWSHVCEWWLSYRTQNEWDHTGQVWGMCEFLQSWWSENGPSYKLVDGLVKATLGKAYMEVWKILGLTNSAKSSDNWKWVNVFYIFFWMDTQEP